MDIYDPGLMAASGRTDGTSTPTGTRSDEPKTELDQNVEKLVGNISHWWSGFAKKSQDSISQARKEMENRGGIVNYAKSEYAKLESSIGEAQKKARDQSQTASQPQDPSLDDTAVFQDAPAQSENSKGKQRAMEDPNLEGTAEATNAPNQGPTLGASVSSLFSKLTSDPRLVQLQHSLTSTLQSVSSPQAQPQNGQGTDKATGVAPTNLQESLSKLSLTIQSHLPHLDLKESQQLATRYLHATESFAREMQSDMKDFVGELVRIVPPEGEDAPTAPSKAVAPGSDGTDAARADEASPAAEAKTSSVRNQTRQPAASTGADPATPEAKAAAAVAEAEDEEDFAWDEDDEEAAAAGTDAGPAPLTKQDEALVATAATPTSAPASAEVKPAQTKADESEDDSDWE